MPPRYAYWTIIAGGLPTAFRAADRDDLMPTFRRIQEKHPDAEMKYFARGKLWASPADARLTREEEERPKSPPRGRDWRPGGEHRDPRQPFKDAKKARNQDRRQQRWERKTRDRDRETPPHGDPLRRPAAPRREFRDQRGPKPWSGKPAAQSERRPTERRPTDRRPAERRPAERRPWSDRNRRSSEPRERRPNEQRERGSFGKRDRQPPRTKPHGDKFPARPSRPFAPKSERRQDAPSKPEPPRTPDYEVPPVPDRPKEPRPKPTEPRIETPTPERGHTPNTGGRMRRKRNE
jgi:hypothetical protein